MTAEQECPLTELPPNQCACKNHRGGTVSGIGIGEPLPVVGPAFEARYGGQCEACGFAIRPGDVIRRVADDEGGYAHAPRCAGDPR